MSVSLTPATATIDSGRMLTLERRRNFQNLVVTFVDPSVTHILSINNTDRPNSPGILSHRKTAKTLRQFPGWDENGLQSATAEIQKWIYESMKEWANSGYPTNKTFVTSHYFKNHQMLVTLSVTHPPHPTPTPHTL